jgi:UDP:flavonoid glycosyltransferase YjiC (YdhE family)
MSGIDILFLSSNGTGMGHLTRLMAYARRADGSTGLHFASMSQAAPVLGAQGLSWEYLPSRADIGLGPRRWNVVFERRLLELVRRVRPRVLVFDGTFPYDGLFARRVRASGCRLVWSRRAMWRPGQGLRGLRRSGEFDLVIEPGELAEEADRGPTVGRTDATRVDPVTLLDPSDLLDRPAAVQALGLVPARPVALLALGAGNISDLDSSLGLLARRLLAERELQIVLTHPIISNRLPKLAERVQAVSTYPISRYFRAIDFAVSAASYNTFHELIRCQVPTAFAPNRSAAMDDQVARARWAHEVGAALHLDTMSPQSVDQVVGALSDRTYRDRLRSRCADLKRPNGAAAAMRLVETLAGAVR